MMRVRTWLAWRPQSQRGRGALQTALAMFLARGLVMLTGLIAVPLTIAYLGPERYGIWGALTSVTACLAFSDLGLGLGLMNAMAAASGRRDAAAGAAVAANGIASLTLVAAIAALVCALILPWLPWAAWLQIGAAGAAQEAGQSLTLLAGCTLLGIALSSIQRIQMGLQTGFLAQYWQSAGSVAGLLGLLAAMHAGAGLPVLVLAQAGAPVLAALGNAIVHLVRVRPRPDWSAVNPHAMARIAHGGAGFFVLQITSILSYSTDNLVIAHTLGPLAVTEFSVPARIFSATAVVLSTALAALWPAYTEARAAGDARWIRIILRRSLIVSFGAALVAAGLLLLLGKPLIHWWVGDRVHPSSLLMLGLALWLVLDTCGAAVSMFLNGLGVVRPQLAFAVLFTACLLAAKFSLLPVFGIGCVPLVTAGCYLLTTLLPYCWLVPRVLRRPG